MSPRWAVLSLSSSSISSGKAVKSILTYSETGSMGSKCTLLHRSSHRVDQATKAPISVGITEDDVMPPVGVSVLLVDGDFTCLAILSKMLHAFGYKDRRHCDHHAGTNNNALVKVLTARRAVDALCIVRAKENELDLILTESQLPDMDKYDLFETLGHISNLPVVIMSADNGKDAILGGSFKGAAFYLVKPLVMKDVKNIWQFAFMNKREKKITGKGVRSSYGESLLDDASGDDLKCVMTTGKQGSLLSKRKEREDMDKENVDDDSGFVKKKKNVIWKIELHEKFLQAVRVLGIDDAHPKKILQLMNVQGLKKEQVASHLQKYRLSLKKGQDANQKTMRIDSAESSSSRYPLSTCNRQGGFLEFFKPQSMTSAYKPEFRSYFRENRNGPMSVPSLDSVSLSNLVDSSPNEMSNFIFKESTLQNRQPHISCPDQFGFGIAAMGESSGYDRIGNYTSEELLKGSLPLSYVGNLDSRAIDWPTLFNNQQGQFLSQKPSSVPPLQSSSVPPPQSEEQAELGGKNREVDELHEIANGSSLLEDFNTLW